MKLLLCGKALKNNALIGRIKQLGYQLFYVSDEKVKASRDLENVDGIICNSFFLHNDIKRFKTLKFVHLISAGLDRVPVEHIIKNKIKLFRAEGVYSVPIAEFVVLKILEVYKKSQVFYTLQERRKWEKQRDLLELTDKNLGILGFGDIGREVAKRLRPFGVKTLVSRNRPLEGVEKELVDELFSRNSMDEVIKRSDILVLSLPLNDRTKHIIDKTRIGFMKEKCVLINISRGEIINQTELINAIRNGKFLGVCLDVFESEPLPQDSVLWELNNVIITPHNAFVSERNQTRLFDLIVKNLSEL